MGFTEIAWLPGGGSRWDIPFELPRALERGSKFRSESFFFFIKCDSMGRGVDMELHERGSEISFRVIGDVTPQFSLILTPSAQRFLAKLQREFGLQRRSL